MEYVERLREWLNLAILDTANSKATSMNTGDRDIDSLGCQELASTCQKNREDLKSLIITCAGLKAELEMVNELISDLNKHFVLTNEGK